jgi:hypothetical protein
VRSGREWPRGQVNQDIELLLMTRARDRQQSLDGPLVLGAETDIPP